MAAACASIWLHLSRASAAKNKRGYEFEEKLKTEWGQACDLRFSKVLIEREPYSGELQIAGLTRFWYTCESALILPARAAETAPIPPAGNFARASGQSLTESSPAPSQSLARNSRCDNLAAAA